MPQFLTLPFKRVGKPNVLLAFSFRVVRHYANNRVFKETSRERPKSAPYLRLKNSKKTSKCQVLSSTVPKKISKIFLNFFEVSGKSHCTEKCKRGPLAVFQHPFFCKIGKKMKGGPFGDIKKIAKKSLTKPKKSTQKNWSRAGLEPMSFRLADLKKP